MTERPLPDIGALLGNFIAQAPEPARPRFLALLERGAAERYRWWADRLPAHATGLRACAAREEEIAESVERIVALSASAREKLDPLAELARGVYGDLFEGVPLLEQLRVQAHAERTGAAAWRAFAAASGDARERDVFERCARLEEESAVHLDGIVAG